MGSGGYGTIGHDKKLGGIREKAQWNEGYVFMVS